jgi:hypothetical protein
VLIEIGNWESKCVVDADDGRNVADHSLGGTGPETLGRAARFGRKAGLRYIHAGNLPGEVGDPENARCLDCQKLLVERFGYRIRGYRLTPDGG